MMGGFKSNFPATGGASATRQPGPRAAIALAAACGGIALALLATTAGPVAAETGPMATPAIPGPTGEARVSTSPEEHTSSTAPALRPSRPMRVLSNEPPLTRAAARQRVETMSPARWLERFGPVVVERHE
ncbi:MAG: hypothetical protein IPK00_09840 [Deltaproteobacteria bacterium]|nr:hypothetical protein [Deltaproteobacteria bacterium]